MWMEEKISIVAEISPGLLGLTHVDACGASGGGTTKSDEGSTYRRTAGNGTASFFLDSRDSR